MSRPDVSVVIVSYNGRDMTRACVASILKNTHSVTYEVVVVDNGSSDGTVQHLATVFPSIHVIANEVNVGYGAACNQGIARAKGRYIMVLNNDTEVFEDTLAILAHALDRGEDIGVAAPQLLNSDGTLQPSTYRFPSLTAAVVRQVVPSTILEASLAAQILRGLAGVLGLNVGRFGRQSESCEIECPMGSAFMVRKEVVSQVGGFDTERFFLFMEEGDWFYRIHKAGWKIYYIVDAGVVHHRHQSVNHYRHRYLVQQQKSLLQYFEKHSSKVFVQIYKSVMGAIFITKAAGYAILAGLWNRERLDRLRKSEAYMTIVQLFVDQSLREKNVMFDLEFEYIE